MELIIVDNGSIEAGTFALLNGLKDDPRVRILNVPGAFNYPFLNNIGVREATGTILMLLNNDVEIIDQGWLKEMVSLTMHPEIGVVGAKLLYPNGRLQHGGVATGPYSAIGHLLHASMGDDPGYCGQLALTRALTAVTGACMSLRREVFMEVGGLDEALAIAFNDIDLCMRVSDLGYRIVWTPNARLIHREGASRGNDLEGANHVRAATEWAFMRSRWGRLLDRDPYHNPNLLLTTELAPLVPASPRRPRPWRK
jgi:GT2 family glycosyltransferase